MTTQRHGDTERPLRGFEATIERGFGWLEANGRTVTVGLIGAVLLGAALAGLYEWAERRDAAAQQALEAVEREFAVAMGAPQVVIVPEPANAETAVEAREVALAGFETVIEEHPGGFAASNASIRAAEMEIDLGRLDAASARLEVLREDLAEGALLAAIVARLHGYVLEERGQRAAAGAAYAAAAAVEEYPARELVWLAAAENFLAAGEDARAADALSEVLSIAPEFGEQMGVVDQLTALQARAAQEPPAN